MQNCQRDIEQENYYLSYYKVYYNSSPGSTNRRNILGSQNLCLMKYSPAMCSNALYILLHCLGS